MLVNIHVQFPNWVVTYRAVANEMPWHIFLNEAHSWSTLSTFICLDSCFSSSYAMSLGMMKLFLQCLHVRKQASKNARQYILLAINSGDLIVIDRNIDVLTNVIKLMEISCFWKLLHLLCIYAELYANIVDICGLFLYLLVYIYIYIYAYRV